MRVHWVIHLATKACTYRKACIDSNSLGTMLINRRRNGGVCMSIANKMIKYVKIMVISQKNNSNGKNIYIRFICRIRLKYSSVMVSYWALEDLGALLGHPSPVSIFTNSKTIFLNNPVSIEERLPGGKWV